MTKIVAALFLLATTFHCIQSRDNYGFVKDIIRNNEIVIFSTGFCPACVAVKDMFRDLNLGFLELVVDQQGENSYEIFNILEHLTRRKSVPQVFIHKKFAGSYKEIEEMYKNGTLEDLIGKN